MPSAARTTTQSAQKVYARSHLTTYKTLCTMTNPATKTKSIGLPADARCCGFCTPPRQLYLDEKLSPRLPGLIHLDKFTWTTNLPSIYRDFCKNHFSHDTDGNFPYHRAVNKQLPLPPNTHPIKTRLSVNQRV